MSTTEEARREAELNRKLDLLIMSFHATLEKYIVAGKDVILKFAIPTIFNPQAHKVTYFYDKWLALSVSFRKNDQADLETHPLGYIKHHSFSCNAACEPHAVYTSDSDHFQKLSEYLQNELYAKDLIVNLIPAETQITPLGEE